MAVGFLDGRAGFAQFTEARVRDPRALALASKIRYAINPADEYPRNFSGHVRARLRDGSEREFRQPYMRGGAHAPLAPAEIEAKFMDNARYGGWDDAMAERFLQLAAEIFTQPTLERLQEFRA
jgi:2-methylcitrate dehydratase PrpD